MSAPHKKCDRGSLVVKAMESCREFDPSSAEDPPCRRAMHVKSVASTNVPRWCGGSSQERGMVAQVSSSSLDYGSKLRSTSPKALE
ncbi:hypothetical protein TNCV_4080031 [Trichonephila clavipes]|nr:hypothetical protein TNCV_4080031 [Trichonephila clavipes]